MVDHLVLLRHGESVANRDGLFTGSWDVPLADGGRREAVRAAHLIDRPGFRPRRVLCSPLSRAIETARLVVSLLGGSPEMVVDWRLSERSYGSLTGRSRVAMAERYGADLLREWRRTLEGKPPPLSASDLVRLRAQAAFVGQPAEAVAATESLADVIARLHPITDDWVQSLGRDGAVLMVGHGNSLRALISLIENLKVGEVNALNVPSAEPFAYRLSPQRVPLPATGHYLSPQTAETAIARLARDGGT